MLYRHACPRYYGEFRDKVISGEIPVSQEVIMEMHRIDALIDNPSVFYDPEPVEAFIEFCENEMTLTDGSDVKLLDSFKLWAEELFGWYYFEETTVPMQREDGRGTRYVRKRTLRRLINEQYLIVGRSNAKSLYVTFVQAYFLICDKRTTVQVTTAPTMAQADEILSPLKTAITRARGPVFKLLTQGSLQNTTGNKNNRQKLASTKKGIQNFLTNSILEVRPMRVDKLQGSRAMIFSIDEWLSGDVREDVTTAAAQSAKKTKDWFVLSISSEGTVRNSVGDDIKIKLMKILKGEFIDPHTSIWWYKLDDESEVHDPNMWMKANPNLGVTVTYDDLQREVDKADAFPADRNDILAKRFGLPKEGFTYFFTFEETLPTSRNREYWQMACSMGIDLSLGDDFCAFTFLFPLGRGEFGIKSLCFISEHTLYHLPLVTRNKYEEMMQEGSLRVLNGAVLNMTEVYDEVDRYIDDCQYDVRCVGYDPYNAKAFIAQWEMRHSPYGVEKVPQGARTESVPLGEIKKLAERRCLIFDQEMIKYTMGNCVAIKDTNGNRKLVKRHNNEKIDAIAALLDAYVSYKVNEELFE